MFLGLSVEPGKLIEQELDEFIQITNVALASFDSEERTTLVLTIQADDCDTDEPEEFTICSLQPGKIEQQSVDLGFEPGQLIGFKVVGPNTVHLTGRVLDADQDLDGMMADSDAESEDVSEDGSVIMEEDDEDEEIDSDVVSGDEQSDDEEAPKLIELTDDAVKQLQKQIQEAAPSDAEEDEVSDDEEEEVAQPEPVSQKPKEQPAKKQQEKRVAEPKKEQPAKKQKVEPAAAAAATAPAPAKEQPPAKKEEESKVRKLPNGLVIEDKTVGTGTRAKNGKRVFVRYVGKLTNGKQFDANKSGKPFSFIVGRGEVIKGWDMGVSGMQVGGVRRLTVPAALAYGKRGAPPDIPGNATLVFDIKLLDVKN